MSAAVPALPAPVSVARARFMPVIGDSMAPTLTPRHMVAVVPVRAYSCDGMYVLDVLPDAMPAIVRCERVFGETDIRLWYDNRAYVGGVVTREWFEETVVGKVAAVLEIADASLLEDVPPG
ncbi:MAG: S24/S26 family peptidase [Acetobacteraceae bacterium]|nr:S24/S26 family peptidase [Acetobacteraceae bacterium]